MKTNTEKRIAVTKALPGVLLILVLAACSTVKMERPFPAKAGAEEIAALGGKWNVDGQVLHVRFGKDGKGHFAGIEWKDDHFQLNEGEFIPHVEGINRYAAVQIKEKGLWEKGYYLVVYRFTGEGKLQVGSPVVETFAKAVEAGKLEGKVKRDKYSTDVALTGAPEKILAFLENPANGNLFSFQDSDTIEKLHLKKKKS